MVWAVFPGFLAFLALCNVLAADETSQVPEILATDKLPGGVACFSPAGDGTEALKLAEGGGWLVLAMDADAAKVATLKEKAAAAGILGRSLYVGQGTAEELPFADNMVDLFVSPGDASPQGRQEILRVLTPILGQAVLGKEIIRKPELPGSDWWTHRLRGPDNNPASNDTAFQLPAMLQFLAIPDQNSFQGTMLAEGGLRIELTDWVSKKPDRDTLVGQLLARNIYNGQILWRRELPGNVEPDTPICALADGRIYLAAGDACRVLVIEARSGEELTSLVLSEDSNDRVKWLAVDGGRLHALVGPALPTRAPLSFVTNNAIRFDQFAAGQTVAVWDLESARSIWQHEEAVTIDYRTIAVADGRTYFYSEKHRLACLDRDGRLLWENREGLWMDELQRKLSRNGNTVALSSLRVGAGVVRLTVEGAAQGLVFDAADGRFLWKNRLAATDFFVGDKFYTHGGAVNPATGEVIEKGNFSIGGWCGIRTWVPGLDSGLGHVAFGLRSPCGVGIFAAGGVISAMASQCDCWPSTRGAGAMMGAGDLLRQVQQSPRHPLEIGEPPGAPSGIVAPGDWPQQRGDTRRSGGVGAVSVAETASLRWVAPAPQPLPVPTGHDQRRWEWLDRPTPPVTAGGLVFSAGSDGAGWAARVDDGTLVWTFWTGGAVLTSPAVADGRVYAGSADGWVYCLDAATGRLVWRWRGSPADRRMMVYGKLMSRWPVTSLLAHEGILYGVAGQWMQNGTVTFALDAGSGAERWRTWTDPDYNHFLDNYLKRDDPPFAPSGVLAFVGRHLWVRDYLGVPAIFDTDTGGRIPVTEDLIQFQKTYWNFGTWFATPGQDLVVVNERLVLQGGYPLLGNPDIRSEKSAARYVALRLNDAGQILALPHPPTAIPSSQITPAIEGDNILIVGGVRDKRRPGSTLGVSLWNLQTWIGQFDLLVNGSPGTKEADDNSPDAAAAGRNSDDPFKKRPPTSSLDMQNALWAHADLDVSAVALCANAALVVTGRRDAGTVGQGRVPPDFLSWEVAAFDRATGQKRWGVALPGEPIFNGLAVAGDGTVVVTLRDGSAAGVK